MKLRNIAMAISLVALTACDNGSAQNPELLKGNGFTTTMNGTAISLDFDADALRVYGKIVNRYNGSYQATGNQIKFGPFMSTMMAGPEDAMAAEHEYFTFMESAQTYKLDGSQLTIKNADGKQIVFTAVEKVATDATESDADTSNTDASEQIAK